MSSLKELVKLIISKIVKATAKTIQSLSTQVFDYAIIGAGAAGLHLAMALLEEPWFVDKSILLLEKSEKNKDDKTWSFWEKGEGNWDTILKHQWHKGAFISQQEHINLQLSPYEYKTILSIDFYNFCKEKIFSSDQITWVQDKVMNIQSSTILQIKGEKDRYQAKQVFDSRPPSLNIDKRKYPYIAQHFKGWEIETSEAVFDPTSFTMMDYRIQWKDTTSFTYVLPYSPRRAFVEFTLFTPELIGREEYNQPLKEYIEHCLHIKAYQITKEEYGIIPMTDFPFHANSQKGIFNIGTAGSWVKASSGYAFKNIERCSRQLVQNIIHSRSLDYQLLHPKFRFYDSILLQVLTHQNELGPSIFADMYRKNTIQKIFKFLDDQTNLVEDIAILNSFDYTPFLKGLFRYIKGKVLQ